MYLTVDDLFVALQDAVRDDLKVLKVMPRSLANNELKNLAEGLVELEQKGKQQRWSKAKVISRFTFLKQRYESFFNKRQEFSTEDVARIMKSSLGAIQITVNTVFEIDLIDVLKKESNLLLDFV